MAGMADFNRTDRTRMGQREGGSMQFGEQSSGTSSQGMSTDQKLAAAKMGLELYKGAGGEGTDSTAGGAAGGALSGAMTGSAFGPIGTAVGAAGGGLMGGMQARSAQKAANRKAEAEHQNRLAGIESDKAQRLQTAIAGMAAGMGAALRR